MEGVSEISVGDEKMIRKILKVKTVGTRTEGNLRPALTDDLLRGLNLVVHEYDETEGTAIIEIFGSDHLALKSEERLTPAKMSEMLKHVSVIEELTTHPKSPPIICRLAVSLDSVAEEVDEQEKTFVKKETKGKHKYLRKDKGHRGEDILVMDEG